MSYFKSVKKDNKEIITFRENLKQFDKALHQEWDDKLDKDTYRKCEILYVSTYNVSIMYLDDMSKSHAYLNELFPLDYFRNKQN